MVPIIPRRIPASASMSASSPSNIIEGKDLHVSTLKLAASYPQPRHGSRRHRAALRDLMRTTPEEKRDARWQSRFDDLPRLVAGAHEKYGDPFAPPLAEMGCGETAIGGACQWQSPQTSAPDDEPLPLFELPAAATAFPVDALPDSVARPIRAIAAKVQVPLSMAAQSVLSVLALALQGHANVRLPYADVAPISEFFLTVAETGDRKSSADREAMRGVVRDRQARALGYDFQYADWRIRHAAWSAQEASIKKRSKLTLQERTEALRELGQAPRPPLKPERIVTEPDDRRHPEDVRRGVAVAWCLHRRGLRRDRRLFDAGRERRRDRRHAVGALGWRADVEGARRRGTHDHRRLPAQLAPDAAARSRHRLDQQHGPDRPGPCFPASSSSGREA